MAPIRANLSHLQGAQGASRRALWHRGGVLSRASPSPHEPGSGSPALNSLQRVARPVSSFCGLKAVITFSATRIGAARLCPRIEARGSVRPPPQDLRDCHIITEQLLELL